MRFLLPLLVLCWSGPVLTESSTVYKSVDEHGVVTFSDVPPEGDTEAQRVEVNAPSPQPTGEYLENLEAMRETTDRMAEDRRAREKHRAELRELAARTEAQRAQSQPGVVEVERYLPGYGTGYHRPGYRPGHPPWHPGLRPPPPHPGLRPPVRPPTQPARPTQGNSQLMRPITTR